MDNVFKNPFADRLKVIVATLCMVCMLFSGACQSDMDNNGDNPFYYNEGEEIQNILFLQLAPTDWEQWNPFWEQWNSLINSDATLQIYNANGDWAFLKTKDEKPITPATIEYFKASPLVVTVSYAVESYGFLQGARNEFVAQLKETTSYAQLEQLAEQNHCTIGRKDDYVKDGFFVAIPKTSELNAMQMSDLFYKTDLFESVQPCFVMLTPNQVYGDKRIIKELKDEPAYIRKTCSLHLKQPTDAVFFEFENEPSDFFWYPGVISLREIPEAYRTEGLSVFISGNIISCEASACEPPPPNARIIYPYLFELKSIKIDN